MADRITLTFGADIAAVERAGTDIVSTLDDVEESLKDVTDASGKNARETTRDMEDFADAADDTKRSIDELPPALEDVDDESKNVAGTVKGELSNAFQDWDGTAEGAVSSVGRGLTGLAALIPGVGGLIGAGLGVVVTEWAKTWGDTAEENAKTVDSMYADMIESGNRFLSATFVQEGLKELFDDEGKVAEVREAADRLGLSVATVAEAWVGVPTAMDQVLAKTDELADKELVSADPSSNLIAYYRSVEGKINDVADATDTAATNASYFEAAVAQNTQRWEETGAAVDEAANKIDNLPTPAPVVLTVDSSALDNALKKPRTLNVTVNGFTRTGQKVI